MQLGIFAKTFGRPNVAFCLQAVADAGIPLPPPPVSTL
jgi:hypothetical protein